MPLSPPYLESFHRVGWRSIRRCNALISDSEAVDRVIHCLEGHLATTIGRRVAACNSYSMSQPDEVRMH
jgi:hypothetical protein